MAQFTDDQRALLEHVRAKVQDLRGPAPSVRAPERDRDLWLGRVDALETVDALIAQMLEGP